METLLESFNYWVYVVLMMIGLFAMITKNNMVKKLIGMSIFQTAIILFFVSLSVPGSIEQGVTIPIVDHSTHHDSHSETTGDLNAHEEPPKDEPHKSPEYIYANPLPHVLMLTAIVVGVATLGVALAIAQVVFKNYGSLEENEILKRISKIDG